MSSFTLKIHLLHTSVFSQLSHVWDCRKSLSGQVPLPYPISYSGEEQWSLDSFYDSLASPVWDFQFKQAVLASNTTKHNSNRSAAMRIPSSRAAVRTVLSHWADSRADGGKWLYACRPENFWCSDSVNNFLPNQTCMYRRYASSTGCPRQSSPCQIEACKLSLCTSCYYVLLLLQ